MIGAVEAGGAESAEGAGDAPDAPVHDDSPVHDTFDTANTVNSSGSVGPLVQAGIIHGGVHHYGTRPPAELPHRSGRVPPRADAFQSRDIGVGWDAPAAPGGLWNHVDVLSGLGGVGKTQLAAGCAERAWAEGVVDLLVWVTASSREAVVGDFARLATDLTGTEDTDPAIGADRLLAWLASTPKRWLVVLDDVRDPADLLDLWPPRTAFGRVVVTTRRRDAALRGEGRRMVEVGLFTPDESAAYLKAKLADRDGWQSGARELAAALGHLPLALAQAATYLLDRRLTCAEYVRRFEDRRRELRALLPEPGSLPDQHRDTVAATWALSVAQADRLEPAGLAAPLLEVMALLDPNGIPVGALTAPAVLFHLKAVTGAEVGAEQARDALMCLDRLSLIAFDPTNVHAEVTVHALVQRAVRDRYTEERARLLPTVAADALLQVWPSIEADTALVQSLRANAAAVHAAAETELWREGRHSLLHRAGASLGGSGLAGAACDYFRQLLETARRQLGPDHRDTLACTADLAFWQGEAGLLGAAVETHELLFTERLRLLGRDHPETLGALGDFAHYMAETGDAARAAAVFQRFLTDPSTAVGAGHPADWSWNGVPGRRHAEVAQAVAVHEDLLRVQSEVLGPDDPATLTTRGRLARWLGEAGDRRGAATAFERLLADRARVLGADHPDTLATRNDQAFAYGEGGDPDRAVTVLRELLRDQERVQGPLHPNTLDTRNNLAVWQKESGDPAGARAALRALLDDQLTILGPDHPSTFTTRGHLARWSGEAGDAQAAASAFEELLADRLRVLGPDHPSIRNTRSNLAYWRARADAEEVPGPARH
ncbi:tetratricopeptide repeat protein [Actinosynnema sp. NPDC023658]|uniref:tetratricopeptide repeat protein n=1 Tax=Actinosynnema sp. NPDC023658 TaxID=3155465 RepID=UPI0033C2BC4C